MAESIWILAPRVPFRISPLVIRAIRATAFSDVLLPRVRHRNELPNILQHKTEPAFYSIFRKSRAVAATNTVTVAARYYLGTKASPIRSGPLLSLRSRGSPSGPPFKSAKQFHPKSKSRVSWQPQTDGPSEGSDGRQDIDRHVIGRGAVEWKKRSRAKRRGGRRRGAACPYIRPARPRRRGPPSSFRHQSRAEANKKNDRTDSQRRRRRGGRTERHTDGEERRRKASGCAVR
jgi:hypothetical protein